MQQRFGRWTKIVAIVATAGIALSACSSKLDGMPRVENAPDAKLNVVGVDSSSSFDQEVQNSLSDIEAFWKINYPKLSGGKSLEPLKGGLYSVDGLEVAKNDAVSGPAAKEACIQSSPGFIVDNGAFCLLDDSIAWDRAQTHLFSQLAKQYGDFMVALVFAHEFGHAISYRLGVFENRPKTIYTESQADCAAGAWAASAIAKQDPHFRDITLDKLDAALEGYLDGRDSTPGTIDEISHGNGFDRLSALADGLEKGVTFCYSKDYFNRTFTERPFTDPKDYDAGGNVPLADVLTTEQNQFVIDLNNFWTDAAKSINKTFQPVKITETSSPKCSGARPSEFFYCPDNNTVFYSRATAQAAYNSLPDVSVEQSTGNVKLLFNQPADFSLGTLFSIGWGMAVRHQLFKRNLTGKGSIQAAVCYTGAYAKDNNVASDPTEHDGIILSPADLDEAVSMLLNKSLIDRSYGAQGSSGLDRIQRFVKGYKGGLSVC